MSKRPTAYKLIVSISAAVIIVLFVFILIFYKYTRNMLYKDVEHKASNISTQVISAVRGEIILTEEVSSNLASQLPFYFSHGKTMVLVNRVMEKYKSFQAIRIEINANNQNQVHGFSASRKENRISYSQDADKPILCAVERKNIEPLIKEGEKGWTNPYMCPAEGSVVSNYYHPIYGKGDNGNSTKIGFVTIELSLNYINEFLNNLDFGNEGFAFLISDDGTYITHPIDSLILNHNFKNLSKRVFKGKKNKLTGIVDDKRPAQFVAYPNLLNFKKSWVYVKPIPKINWQLVYVKSFSEIYKQTTNLIIFLVVLAILGVLVIIFVVSAISTKVLSPLSQIASQIHYFSFRGEEDGIKNEVDSLETSLDQLQDRYYGYKSEQDRLQRNDKRFKYDLLQAQEIQKSIIPDQFPAFPDRPEIEIYSTYKPANIVSGDLFDYFFLNDDHLLIAIGDVSGKGIPAALFMGMAHTLLRSGLTHFVVNPVIRVLNEELCEKNQNQFFLTMFLGILNVRTGLLNYCNAAHTTSYILSKKGKVTELNEAHGLPLGLYPDRPYADSFKILSNDDTLVIYTDGVTDATNTKGKNFGEERLKENLLNLYSESPKEIIKKVTEKVDIFSMGTPQSDDLSMVALKYRQK